MSCCKSFPCFRTLKRACYTIGVYTLIISIMAICSKNAENVEDPQGLDNTSERELEFRQLQLSGGFGTANVVLYSLLLVSSILLIIGLYRDLPFYLIPWMLFILSISVLEFVHSILYIKELRRNAIIGVFLFLNIIFIVINICAFRCVYLQYKKYRSERRQGVPPVSCQVTQRDPSVNQTTYQWNSTTKNVNNVQKNQNPSNVGFAKSEPKKSINKPKTDLTKTSKNKNKDKDDDISSEGDDSYNQPSHVPSVHCSTNIDTDRHHTTSEKNECHVQPYVPSVHCSTNMNTDRHHTTSERNECHVQPSYAPSCVVNFHSDDRSSSSPDKQNSYSGASNDDD